jgi:energy-coupling factor transport system ATP-binding protein
MLIARPSALILDEPTYGQDKASTQRMMSSLFESAHARNEELTLMLVTHDMKLVAMYADRAIVMRQGQVAYDGPVADLFRQEELLADANLEEPPLYAIAERLRRLGRDVPAIVSVEEFVQSCVVPERVLDERVG